MFTDVEVLKMIAGRFVGIDVDNLTKYEKRVTQILVETGWLEISDNEYIYGHKVQ